MANEERKIFLSMEPKEIARYVHTLARELHKKGATTKKLAKVFDCSKSVVERVVKR